MGQVGPRLKAASGDAFDKTTLLLFLLYLAAVSLASYFSTPAVGFFLVPIPLLFYKLDSVRFMFLSLACYLLFFECFQPMSNFLFFNTPDSLFAVFVLLRIFFRKDFLGFNLPFSGLLLPLYLLLLDGVIMTIPSLFQYGVDFYVFRDFKNLLYLALAAILCRNDEPLFDAKNLFRMLLAFILFTSAHAAVLLIQFLASGLRLITWNEVFFSDAILMIAALLPIAKNPRTRMILYSALPICILGLLATQTRGLWGSTLISLGVYFCLRLVRARVFSIGKIFKGLQAAVAFAVLAEIIMRVSVGMSLFDFIRMRALSFAPHELIDPNTSLGYRIHESLVVWEKRTWFGHGSGARLYIYFTQLGVSKFINWWSIHSEYFEMLHKYGFVGLGIFLWFLFSLLRRSLRIALDSHAFESAMGFLAFITILNHCLVSITSGYLIRENVMLYMVLMIGIVERYHPRTMARKRMAKAEAASRIQGSG